MKKNLIEKQTEYVSCRFVYHIVYSIVLVIYPY